MKKRSIERLKESVGGGRRSAVAQAAVYAGTAAAASGAIIIKSGPVSAPDYPDPAVGWDIDGDASDELSIYAISYDPACHGTCVRDFAVGTALANAGCEVLPIGTGDVVGVCNSFWQPSLSSYNDPNGYCGPGAPGSVLYGGLSPFVGGGSIWGDDPGELLPLEITGYFGFQFDNGGTTNYGFARFEAFLDGGTGTPDFTITDWAYDDTGADISFFALGTAPVPEPSRLGLLALGMGAAGLLRRRREKVAN